MSFMCLHVLLDVLGNRWFRDLKGPVDPFMSGVFSIDRLEGKVPSPVSPDFHLVEEPHHQILTERNCSPRFDGTETRRI